MQSAPNTFFAELQRAMTDARPPVPNDFLYQPHQLQTRFLGSRKRGYVLTFEDRSPSGPWLACSVGKGYGMRLVDNEDWNRQCIQ
jgi:hypothetical protein